MKEYVMGNGAIALGALASGVNLVAGYPGTPSSEIIENIARHPHDGLHVEWSVNEKAAMEVATAAAYAGARAMVTMKQVGLNVASDPLMSLAYVGVKGGMVIVSADDPGPISSQTEQDTRRFADFARIPVFDPSSVDDCFQMVQEAFEYSEKYHTPVLFRPTTRVCHAYGSVEAPDSYIPHTFEGFVKDSKKWVIFPRLSFANHAMIEERNVKIGEDFSEYAFNSAIVYEKSSDSANIAADATEVGATSANSAEKSIKTKSENKIIFASGISYSYAREALKSLKTAEDFPGTKLVRIATAFPFPEPFAAEQLKDGAEVLVLEELSPYVEEQLLKLSGRKHLNITVKGKLTGNVPHSGELNANMVEAFLAEFLGMKKAGEMAADNMPALPVRPPVLCAGCPHRASFYAVKLATKGLSKIGKKAYYCGDIGCYTLGNAMPLDMVDTCLCMGAGINMAQGFNWMEPDAETFAFVGDSTFFASGITGVVNAVYNGANMTLIVLDNSTTAMTGHQPHPGTGINLMQNVVDKVSIQKVLEGIGVKTILTVNPLNLEEAVNAAKTCMETRGVKAIIYKSPCIAIEKSKKKCHISEKCINCKKCIREIGCPALITVDGQTTIDTNLCTGCGLCSQICPVNAIGGDQNE